MGKRGRSRKIIRREEEDGESAFAPPSKLNQQSPPGPYSSPTPSLGSLSSRSKYTTQQLVEKADHLSPAMAKIPTTVLPQAQDSLSARSRCVTRAYLARCGTSRTPLRSSTRNVKVVPCVSSGSTPERNVLAENVDLPSPASVEIPSSKLPQVQEPLSSGLHTFPAAASSRSPDQNLDGHNQKDNPSSPASSFNCTEIAANVANDSFDPDEVATKAYPSLVTVIGYRVKEQMAPLLRSIISKYGDIGKECTFQSLEIRSSLMERVCGIYQNLEKTESLLFTPVELKSTLDVVDDLESARVNVRWLRKRLDEINEAFQLSKGYSALKEALASNLIATERKKKDLKVLQDELDAMVAEREKINEALLGTRAKIKIFYSGSLVNGLL
ncbi:hypothetical protein LguiA_005780 [Lonicera macranthoides]